MVGMFNLLTLPSISNEYVITVGLSKLGTNYVDLSTVCSEYPMVNTARMGFRGLLTIFVYMTGIVSLVQITKHSFVG